MRFFMGLALLSAALCLPLTGCGGKTDVKKADKEHDHDHDHHGHDHDHAAHGPHGGHIMELGDEEYHAEWTHDDKSGNVTVYILDSTMKKEVPIEAESITIKTSVKGADGDQETTYTLAAVNPSTGDKPTASQFEITDQALLTVLKAIGGGASATLELPINGKPYVAKFEAHSDHDHGHKH